MANRSKLRKLADELKSTPIIFDEGKEPVKVEPSIKERINTYYKSDDEKLDKCWTSSIDKIVDGETETTAICEFVDEDEPDDSPKGVVWFDRTALRNCLPKAKDDTHRNFISKILSTKENKPALTVDDEKVFDELQDQFPNFVDVINFYKAQLRLCAITGRTRINPVLLLGPPGVGKTLFSRKLAHALKTGFTYIDMASASSAWVLSGLHATWHGAKCGKILDAMIYSPTASPIVLLDELEKPVSPERDPKNALYQLLEESSACAFVDEFLDHPVNLSSIIYVACANGLDGISEPLLTRFKIFDIAAPSVDEQAAIVKKCI